MKYVTPSKASITFQIVIWSVLFIVFSILNEFAFEEPFTRTYSASIFNMIMNIILVNVHLYILIPSFFKKKTILQYLFFLLLIVTLLSLLKASSIYWIKPEEIEESFFVSKAPKIAFTTSFLILVITLPLLLFDELIRKEVEKANIKTKALETELQFLKSQVNPHFLFNVLNNIYSMIYTKSGDAGTTILKLSGLMRYMLYDTSEAFVLLEKEVNYLQEYIDLQTIKQIDGATVHFSVNQFPNDLKVPPFLLIPFLENAFKHGNWDAENKKGWIKSEILYENHTLIYNLSNSISSPTKKKNVKGIGLENVQQRLQLFYPDKHSLTLKQTKSRYDVFLRIQFS